MFILFYCHYASPTWSKPASWGEKSVVAEPRAPGSSRRGWGPPPTRTTWIFLSSTLTCSELRLIVQDRSRGTLREYSWTPVFATADNMLHQSEISLVKDCYAKPVPGYFYMASCKQTSAAKTVIKNPISQYTCTCKTFFSAEQIEQAPMSKYSQRGMYCMALFGLPRLRFSAFRLYAKTW